MKPLTMVFICAAVLSGQSASQALLVGNKAAASCVISSGTTLTETFGNLGTLGCGFGSGTNCNNVWSTASGSPVIGNTSDIVGCSHALSLPSNASIQTTGGFPVIPSGGTVDYFTGFYVTTLGTPSYGAYLAFTDGIGDTPAEVLFTQSGTTLQVNACNSGCGSESGTINSAAGVYVALQVHLQSGAGNSYIAANGGAHQTFTVSAFKINTVFVGSPSTTVMRVDFLYSNSAYGGGFPPTSTMFSSAGTNGAAISAATVNSSTVCGNGAWTATQTTSTWSNTVSGNLPHNSNPCGLGSLSGNAGISLKFDTNTTDIATYTPVSYQTTWSHMFMWQTTLLNTDSTTDQDVASILPNTGDGFYVQCLGNGTTLRLRIEVGASAAVTDIVNILDNTTYIIVMTYTKGAPYVAQVYSATGTLLGTATGVVQTAGQPVSFSYGHVGGSTISGYFQYIWNIQYDVQSGVALVP